MTKPEATEKTKLFKDEEPKKTYSASRQPERIFMPRYEFSLWIKTPSNLKWPAVNLSNNRQNIKPR